MIETLQIFIEAPIELKTIILACLIMGIYWHFKKEGKNQILCDNCGVCDWLDNKNELIETFDNELLCSPCYIKKEGKR